MRKLEVSIGASRWALWLFAGSHLAALFAILALPLPWYLQIVFAGLVALGAESGRRSPGCSLGGRKVVGLCWHDGVWAIAWRARPGSVVDVATDERPPAEYQTIETLTQSIVWPMLIVLIISCGPVRHTKLLVWRDAVSDAHFRHLSRLLRLTS